jgi:hypothetical protein
MNDAAHLGLELLAYDIQQVGEVRIVGSFLHAHATCVGVAQVCEKGLDVLVIRQRSIMPHVRKRRNCILLHRRGITTHCDCRWLPTEPHPG